MSAYSQPIVITDTATGTAYDLYAENIISMIDNGAGTDVTFLDNGATPKIAAVDEAVADISTACQVTIPVTDVNGDIIYLNVDRIVDVRTYTSGTLNAKIIYNAGGATNQIFTVTETRSQIRTAADLIITAAAGIYAQTDASNEWTVYQVFDAPNRQSLDAAVTAHAGGGQGSATALTKYYSNITTCATAGDSVKLLTAAVGTVQVVKNNGATTLAVFPFSGDAINGGSADASVDLNPGDQLSFTATTAGNWETEGIESLGTLFFSGDIHGAKEVDHVMLVDTTTTAATVGGKMTITAGAGATSGAGGALALNAGAGGATGAGGAVTITSGAATNVTSGTGAASGAVTITTGVNATATTGTGGAGALIQVLGAAGGAATGAAGIGGAGSAAKLQSGAGGASSSATGGNGGAGGAVTIQSGVGGAATGATATGGAAGAIAVTGGAGGAALDNAGIGTSTGGAGAALTVTMGAGGALGATDTGTSGAGGAISLTAGAGGAATAGTSGAAGAVSITAGASGASTTGTGATGGAVTITSGAGALASAGGLVSMIGGAGGATGIGGGITITSGAGGSTSAGSGAVNIKSGTTISGTGGLVLLGSGNATSGTSGAATLSTGTGTTASGAISITSGAATTTAGAITLTTGAAVTAGNIVLNPGAASSTTVSPIVITGSNLVRKPVATGTVATGAVATGINVVNGYFAVTGATGTVTLPDTSAITTAVGATPAGTTLEFIVDATSMTATNVVTLAAGANMTILKQTSAGDSASGQLMTVTQTAGTNIGVFKIVYVTSTTCVIGRVI